MKDSETVGDSEVSGAWAMAKDLKTVGSSAS